MTDTDIVTFCDPAEASENPEEVMFCDPAEKSEEPEEVVFCDPENKSEECLGLDPLVVTGTETPDVGSTYSVTGGLAPYTWSISSGEINSDGQVTSVAGACGGGTVTVTDSCGRSASLSVRFPSGQWVFDHMDPYYCYPGTYEYNCNQPSPGCSSKATHSLTTGSTRVDYLYVRTNNCTSDYCAKGDYTKVYPGGTFANGDVNTSSYVFCLWKIEYYNWECP